MNSIEMDIHKIIKYYPYYFDNVFVELGGIHSPNFSYEKLVKIFRNIIIKNKLTCFWANVGLSMSFIKEFIDLVDWYFVYNHQKLSTEFIIENYEKIQPVINFQYKRMMDE